MEEVPLRKDFKYYISRFIHELLEAMALLGILSLLRNQTNADFNWYNFAKQALILTSVTFALEEYDSDFKQQIKSGMTFTVGSSLMAS